MVENGSLQEDRHQRSVLLQLEQLQRVMRAYDNTPRVKVRDRDTKVHVNQPRCVEDANGPGNSKRKIEDTEAEQVWKSVKLTIGLI